MREFPSGGPLFVMVTNQDFGPALRRRSDPLINGVGPIEAAISVASRLQDMAQASTLRLLRTL